MRLLLIHADEFEYEVKDKAVSTPEAVNAANKYHKAGNSLVAFCTVESSDGEDADQIASNATATIVEEADAVGVRSIILYPYAHLSSDLADPALAMRVLDKLTERLASTGYDVKRSPFGWYKRFKISCKGHPLSELSRTIKTAPLPKAAVAEKTYHKVLTPNLELHDPEVFLRETEDQEFRSLLEKEALKRELPGGKEPTYLRYCKKFGIQWEPYSDLGHMRFSPEGTFIFELISQYARAVANSLGIPVFHVRGTNLFDLSVPAVKEHADLFGGRLYEIQIDQKRYVLRYAACHQQFAMIKDWTLSYRDLPLGAFEIADSYRMEQDGELLLCFRVRKMHMPDLHILCRDVDQAEQVALRVHERIHEEAKKLGRRYVSLCNTTERYFKERQSFFQELLKVEKGPVLLNFVPEKYYWTINIEYNLIDELSRPREIGTFQIDVGNARRFGITYTDEKGQKQYPPIIHTALIGTIERYLFAVLDTIVRGEAEGKTPMLPLWLSPVQVRIAPVSKDFLAAADELSAKLEEAGVRSDVDDSDETLSKKIRRGEVAWVPYIVVLGEKEVSSGKLTVRVRGGSARKEYTLEQLAVEVKKLTVGYPWMPLPLPQRLSRRPIFRSE